MAKTTSPLQTEIKSQAAESAPNGPQSPRPKRPWGRLLFGLVALLVLGGLTALALLATRGSDTTPIQARPTPAPTLSATNTPPGSPTSAVASLGPSGLTARTALNQLAVNPGDYQNLFAAMSDGLRRSADGGKTWAEIADFKGQNVTALVFDGDDGERPAYLATDRTGLFKSTDGGKSWKNLGFAGRPITRLAVAKRNLYLAVAGPRPSIYRSADAGQTFSAPALNNLPPTLNIQSIAIDSANPQNVYIGTAYTAGGRTPDWGRVKYSGDGGKTWRDLGQWGPDQVDGPSATRPITLLLYAQGDRLYAGDGDNLWRLTPDRASWQVVTGGLPTNGIYGLAPDPQQGIQGLVYAATRDGFYRNSDGQSWQKLATGESGLLFSATTNQSQPTIWPTLLTAPTGNLANSVNGLRSTYLYALGSDGLLARYENRDFGSELVAVVPGASNVPDFSPYGGVNPVERVAGPAQGAPADPNKRYFDETGHYLVGQFKDTWELPGRGLLLYGYPLTEQFQEFDVLDKTTKVVQYFERFRFEIDKTGNVRTSLIGYVAIEGRYFPPGRLIPTTANQQYFAETKHILKGEFFKFFWSNGDLTRLGFPITEEFTEKGPDGKEMVYQYFQRAKLAFDPDIKKVSIALLGREVLQKRNWLK